MSGLRAIYKIFQVFPNVEASHYLPSPALETMQISVVLTRALHRVRAGQNLKSFEVLGKILKILTLINPAQDGSGTGF